MKRREFLRTGTLAVVGTTFGSGVAIARTDPPHPLPQGTTPARRIAESVNAHFRKSPVRADHYERRGVPRVYVTLTTRARDTDSPQKIGGSWYYDVDTASWHQKKGWVSPGTEAQYGSLVARVERHIRDTLA